MNINTLIKYKFFNATVQRLSRSQSEKLVKTLCILHLVLLYTDIASYRLGTYTYICVQVYIFIHI